MCWSSFDIYITFCLEDCISAVFIGLDGRFLKCLIGIARKPALTSKSAQNKRIKAWERHPRVIMTKIDYEMLDKAVNHHRSAALGHARGDQPEVGLHRAHFQEPAAGNP